jgi:hypothetical protein
MSFAAKVLGSKSNLLWLIQGDHKSLRAWWFLLVNPAKLEIFKKSLEKKDIQLTDYGEIISSGYGQNPTDADIAYLKQKGFKLQGDGA